MAWYTNVSAINLKSNKKLKLVSDNPVYEPYEISGEDVLEIWKAKAYISTHLPLPAPEPTMESLTTMMAQMQRSISNLQQIIRLVISSLIKLTALTFLNFITHCNNSNHYNYDLKSQSNN